MPTISLKKSRPANSVRITLGPDEATTSVLRILELLRLAGVVDLRHANQDKITFEFMCPAESQKDWAASVVAHATKYGLLAEPMQRSCDA